MRDNIFEFFVNELSMIIPNLYNICKINFDLFQKFINYARQKICNN